MGRFCEIFAKLQVHFSGFSYTLSSEFKNDIKVGRLDCMSTDRVCAGSLMGRGG